MVQYHNSEIGRGTTAGPHAAQMAVTTSCRLRQEQCSVAWRPNRRCTANASRKRARQGHADAGPRL